MLLRLLSFRRSMSMSQCSCRMLVTSSRAVSTVVLPLAKSFILRTRLKSPSSPLRTFSSTPYPLYYELINYHPNSRHIRRNPKPSSAAASISESNFEPSSSSPGKPINDSEPMDHAKRRYYRKRQKRMYGESSSDSDSYSGRQSADEDFVELKPEIVDFPKLHAREQEIYFYDAFAMPWEKDKHYRMVYQLEKKYFPEHSLDKAFADPVAKLPPPELQMEATCQGKKLRRLPNMNEDEDRDERALMFFEEKKDNEVEKKDVGSDVSEKKVEEFFKSLKKVPNAQGRSDAAAAKDSEEPFVSSRKSGLPAKWDGPSGTVVLVDKPKGWTSFTVCGKLRRLVKVQKVGHAGTLDPMASGLLIICVGKATKLVERYQGMVKGYSGIFRIGEATSTWDADSPVIQREPWEHIRDDEIRKAAASFCGEIWQVPPMFSAIKTKFNFSGLML